MTHVSIPWTLQESPEPKLLKQCRKEMQLKEIAKKKEVNSPVAISKIIKFLKENRNDTFTNKQIASFTGLSGSVVAGIMDKLEEIGSVKVVKIRKNTTSGISQVYQSSEGNLSKVEKERGTKGSVSKVLQVFNTDTNKIYTKAEIASLIGISKDRVGQALSVLLITDRIKIVGAQDSSFIYQHASGNKSKRNVSTEPSAEYLTLNNYLKINGIKNTTKVNLSEDHSRLFYSNKGIITEYEIAYLQKVLGFGKEHENKKNIFSKILTW